MICVLLILDACAGGVGPDDPRPTDITVLWRSASIRASAVPAVDDSTLLVFDLLGVLHALRRRDGSERWQKSISGAETFVDLELSSETAILSKGGLHALDATTGIERWQQLGFGSPRLAVRDSLLVPALDPVGGSIQLLDVLSGVTRWSRSLLPIDSIVTIIGFLTYRSATITVASIVVPFDLRNGAGILRGGVGTLDARTGDRRWARLLPIHNSGSTTSASIAAANAGTIVVSADDGFFYCFDEFTGVLRWTGSPASLGGTVLAQDSRSVAIVGSYVAIGSSFGLINIHDVRNGQLLRSVNSQLGAVRAFFQVRDGLVLSHHVAGGLALTELATGAIRWRLSPRTDADRVDALRVVGDTVFATSAVSGLTVFRLP